MQVLNPIVLDGASVNRLGKRPVEAPAASSRPPLVTPKVAAMVRYIIHMREQQAATVVASSGGNDVAMADAVQLPSTPSHRGDGCASPTKRARSNDIEVVNAPGSNHKSADGPDSHEDVEEAAAGADDNGWSCIVFVARKVTALVIKALLKRLQQVQQAKLVPGLFVGGGGSSSASSLGMNYKEQARQMQRFHDGAFNVMLATGKTPFRI